MEATSFQNFFKNKIIFKIVFFNKADFMLYNI